MTSSNWITLQAWDSEYSADSVEWCPHDPYQNIFVCGTYQLVKDEIYTETAGEQNNKPVERRGRILLFSVIENKLKLEQSLEVPAVLDQKWCHNQINGKSVLGVVNAAGFLQIYELHEKNLILITQININSEYTDLLALSLDWSTGKINSIEPNIVISDSKGNISIWKFIENNLLMVKYWRAHDFEAWIAAFNYWDSNVVYTGGDDLMFKSFDLRIGTTPIFINKKHEAGVTSFHSNSKTEHLLASGSYDEHLYIWDTRKIKSPLSKTNLTGGVWRLKWDPFNHDQLLAACMYGGFKAISCKNTENAQIIAEYQEHESIAYGVDWCHLNTDPNDILIGTCSFYDHKLCISKLIINS